MYMRCKKLTKILLSLLLFFVLSTTFSFAGFGVSPTDIYSEHLKPGASFTQEFTLSRSDATSDMNIEILPDLGEMNPWFSFGPNTSFVFKKGETTKKFQVNVKVPSGAKYSDYKGAIRVNALPSLQAVGGVSITQGLRLNAYLVVTEQDFRELSILSIKALDSQEGKPIRVEIVGENTGNVDASPTLKVTVMDMLMNVLEVHEVANFGFVSPNETKTLIAEIESQLPTGEYFINVQVLLDGKVLREERLVFNIVNIPAEKEETKEETKPVFSIGSIFKDILPSLPYIAISILIVLISYLLIGLIWRRKDLQSAKEKIWAVILGSKKHSRIGLSFFIGLSILLLLIFYPLVSEIDHRNELDVNGDTQGVQDNKVEKAYLNVLPEVTEQEFLIYETQDTNSKVLYKASDGENFEVLNETEKWYQIVLKDGSSGWLEKSLVKSAETEDR